MEGIFLPKLSLLIIRLTNKHGGGKNHLSEKRLLSNELPASDGDASAGGGKSK